MTASPRPPFIALIALVAGCGPGSGLREPDAYLGCASDESWRTFDDLERAGRIKIDDAQAPAFQSPAPGARLPAAPPPTFAWQPSPTAQGKPGGTAACMQCPSCGPLTAAHLPPVSGDIYDLQLASAGTIAYRVITTVQSWTPGEATWGLLRGKEVELTMTRVGVKVNEIADGPWRATKPLAFQVEK